MENVLLATSSIKSMTITRHTITSHGSLFSPKSDDAVLKCYVLHNDSAARRKHSSASSTSPFKHTIHPVTGCVKLFVYQFTILTHLNVQTQVNQQKRHETPGTRNWRMNNTEFVYRRDNLDKPRDAERLTSGTTTTEVQNYQKILYGRADVWYSTQPLVWTISSCFMK